MTTPLADIICAPATAPGGALGVVRVSGPNAVNTVSEILEKSIKNIEGGKVVFRRIIQNDNVLDEVLVSIFRAPHSYTGEESVEISCHGSEYIMQQILELFIEKGCRMAEPGEFTRRAYLNGKMDLAEAEAVADLIASSSAAAHRIAMQQMRGEFSNTLKLLRERLLHLTTLLELELDFSDQEDLEFADRKELHLLLSNLITDINQLTQSFHLGNAIKEGVPVAIVGKTNVGKSTLLNSLIGTQRAIVSPIHGTTRDTVEDTITLGGIRFRFIDTAGLRQTDDIVEQIGIKRSTEALEKADVILWVVDDMDGVEKDETYHHLLQLPQLPPIFLLINKIDLCNYDAQELKPKIVKIKKNIPTIIGPLFICAKSGEGIEEMRTNLIQEFKNKISAYSTPLVCNIRHFNALTKSVEHANAALNALDHNISPEFVSEDLRACTNALSEIVGEISSQDVLNNVFKNFCVGK